MTTRSLVLQADSHFRLPFLRNGEPGRWRLACIQGRLWITQPGDGRDVVLQAGDELVVDTAPGLLLGALRDSELQLEWLPADPLRPVPAWRARLGLLLQRWWHQPSALAITACAPKTKESGGAGYSVHATFCKELD